MVTKTVCMVVIPQSYAEKHKRDHNRIEEAHLERLLMAEYDIQEEVVINQRIDKGFSDATQGIRVYVDAENQHMLSEGLVLLSGNEYQKMARFEHMSPDKTNIYTAMARALHERRIEKNGTEPQFIKKNCQVRFHANVRALIKLESLHIKLNLTIMQETAAFQEAIRSNVDLLTEINNCKQKADETCDAANQCQLNQAGGAELVLADLRNSYRELIKNNREFIENNIVKTESPEVTNKSFLKRIEDIQHLTDTLGKTLAPIVH